MIPEMLPELRNGMSLIWMSFQRGLFAGSFDSPNGGNSSLDEPPFFNFRIYLKVTKPLLNNILSPTYILKQGCKKNVLIWLDNYLLK